MLGPRLVLLSLLAANLPACAPEPANPLASLCQADIRSWLPRPETAEFLEFEPISQQQWEEQVVDVMTGHMINDPPPIRDFFVAQVRSRAFATAENVTAQGGAFYRYAFKSLDPSGASRASAQYCAATKTACSCVSQEEKEAKRGAVL